MDSFELNKIIAAILMVALLAIGLGKIADEIFHVNKPEKPGYSIEVENNLTAVKTKTTIEEKIDIVALMAQGDVVSGKPNGLGIFIFPKWRELDENEPKYVGSWKDGKYNGQGTLSKPNGYKYVGEWKEGKNETCILLGWIRGNI